MNKTHTYKHWRLVTDKQMLWLYFDKQGTSVNTINMEVMEELAHILDFLATDKTHQGLVIASGKKNGFIAGADIAQFQQLKDIDQAARLLRQGQQIFAQLASLSMPSVAMIDGFCLGGGMELALACTYRVAEESAKTRLGLPEVKLGIHPGWGGTVRLPRLIGALPALNMILSGHTVSGKVAAKLGIVDAAVPRRQLVHAATYYILQQPARHQPPLLQAWSNQKLPRQIIGYFVRKQLNKKINPLHYPSPFDVLNNWEYVGVDHQDAFEREAKTCSKLFFSDTSQNLVHVFFLQERLKSLSKKSSFTPQHVHVIGAGTMGGDIAAWCALQGMTVTLQDLEPRFIAPAIKRGYILFKERLKENYLIQKAVDRLIPDVKGEGIAKADIIIEAVIEDLTVKQNTFKMLENEARQDAILATNTSSILLDDINVVLSAPERLVGIHFFNPVAKMQLVEVVKGKHTSDDIVDQAISFIRKIDHLPLPVKSSPGFLVNRILMPYMLESINIVNEGIPITVVDEAMTQFGMPMGPITLADAVGLDICLSVAQYLSQYFNVTIPTQLTELVTQKKLGRKTSQGFYRYDRKGKKIISGQSPYHKSLQEITDRLVLCLLNESFACLHERIVADPDLLDAGMVYGTGFAPFRGGPIHYAKTQGVSSLYEQFVQQQQARGQLVPMQAWEIEG
jgi:3-hydroxyacyl-CoA dehydrogenase / enoyl-CoA hydratase / 3-hydroxybutyryl-CoA epimerase